MEVLVGVVHVVEESLQVVEGGRGGWFVDWTQKTPGGGYPWGRGGRGGGWRTEEDVGFILVVDIVVVLEEDGHIQNLEEDGDIVERNLLCW